jgi:hypothetical protein
MRRLVSCLATAVGLTAAPAGAADDVAERWLTITGTRISHATLVVTEETRYRPGDATASFAGGGWAGFVIGQDRPALWLPGEPWNRVMTGTPWTHHRNGDGLLRPGRYRIYLFADGVETTVRIPWTGRDTTIRPDALLDAKVTVDRAPVATQTRTSLSVPLDGRSRTMVDAVSYFESAYSASYRNVGCFRRPDDPTPCRAEQRPSTAGTLTGDNFHGTKWGASAGLEFRGEIVGEATGLVTVLAVRYPYPAPYTRDGVDYGYR